MLKPRFMSLSVLVISLLALALLGCETQSSPGGTSQGGGGGDQGTAKRGGTLRYWATPIVQLDPCEQNASSSASPQALIYGKLTRYSNEDYYDTRLLPREAESWEASPDGKKYTFKLKKGVKWHNLPPVNGREFTSADVAWNIEFSKTCKTQGKLYWESVVKHEEPDPYTIVMYLDKPVASFLMYTAQNFNFILPREVFEKDGGFAKTVIGTGPFMNDTYEKDVVWKLKRNPDYHEISKVDNKPLPYVDAFEEYFMNDPASRLTAFRTGQIDLWWVVGGPTPSELKSLTDGNPNMIVNKVMRATPSGVIMSQKRAFKDFKLRQAISFAIDRDKISQTAMEGEAHYNSMIPSGITTYAWSQEKIKSMPNWQYKPEEAKRLIKDGGYSGLPMKFRGSLQVSTMGLGEKIAAEIICQDLKQAGLACENVWPDPGASTKDSRSGEYDLGWTTGNANMDPDEWTLSYYKTGATNNYTHVSDPKLDEIVVAQSIAVSETERKKLLEDFQQHMHDNLYFIPLPRMWEFKVSQPWIKGMGPLHWSYTLPGVERAWTDKK